MPFVFPSFCRRFQPPDFNKNHTRELNEKPPGAGRATHLQRADGGCQRCQHGDCGWSVSGGVVSGVPGIPGT